MVKITFKNVNQGDSIIIEWQENKINKIAIVDCNKFNSSINPILTHISSNNIEEIDFMLLSHPHKDHFSGFIEVIEYCRANKIKINKFLHTSNITLDYLKFASRNHSESKQIIKLFKLLKEMRFNNEIEIYVVDDNPDLVKNLGDEFNLTFLSPSSLEHDNFISSGSYGFNGQKEINFNANLLSTFIKIYNDESMIILTSDSESETFTRLYKGSNKRLGKHKLMLGQISHHGSKDNFDKKFWSSVKKHRITNTIISVGENNYGHPAAEVIDFFNKNMNYHTERTDSQSTLETNKANEISNLLNVFSTKTNKLNESEVINGDKCYEITGSLCKLV